MTGTLSKRRSFSAWLKRKVGHNHAATRKIAPASNQGVFGVPLVDSIQYARYSISYQDENAVVYRQAGAIPTLVAKTGYYLKQNALQTEGIFRLSGSAKRVAALQQVFDDPIRGYGANVDWEGNTVHDVATLMRRFLNQLPDPVITHKYYQAFRDVMSDKAQKSTEQQINAYQELIQKLPLAHQQLLLYLLDMLHLFAAHAAETKMDVCNLAAVFCPAILSHPAHNTPVQYKISQRVLEFLIEFQALFTMQVVRKSSAPCSPTDTLVQKDKDLPAVPSLPDWAKLQNEGQPGKQYQVPPPLDMKGVRRQRGDSMIDSGTDVRTPATMLLSSKLDPTIQDVDEDEACETSTPRAVVSRSPLSARPGASLLSSYQGAWQQHASKIPSWVIVAVAVLGALGGGFGAYQAMTWRNGLNTAVFCVGLFAFSTMLWDGIRSHEGEKSVPEEQEGQKGEMSDDSEEAMLNDPSLMSQWSDLITRKWRNDSGSTPRSLLNNSEYFPPHDDDAAQHQQQQQQDAESMMSISSRFEETDPAEPYAYNDDTDEDDDLPSFEDSELERLWQQFLQVEKDQELAEQMQQEEKEAAIRTNPFLAHDDKEKSAVSLNDG